MVEIVRELIHILGMCLAYFLVCSSVLRHLEHHKMPKVGPVLDYYWPDMVQSFLPSENSETNHHTCQVSRSRVSGIPVSYIEWNILPASRVALKLALVWPASVDLPVFSRARKPVFSLRPAVEREYSAMLVLEVPEPWWKRFCNASAVARLSMERWKNRKKNVNVEEKKNILFCGFGWEFIASSLNDRAPVAVYERRCVYVWPVSLLCLADRIPAAAVRILVAVDYIRVSVGHIALLVHRSLCWAELSMASSWTVVIHRLHWNFVRLLVVVAAITSVPETEAMMPFDTHEMDRDENTLRHISNKQSKLSSALWSNCTFVEYFWFRTH